MDFFWQALFCPVFVGCFLFVEKRWELVGWQGGLQEVTVSFKRKRFSFSEWKIKAKWKIKASEDELSLVSENDVLFLTEP